jgi:hypothetical protein
MMAPEAVGRSLTHLKVLGDWNVLREKGSLAASYSSSISTQITVSGFFRTFTCVAETSYYQFTVLLRTVRCQISLLTVFSSKDTARCQVGPSAVC